MTLINPPSESQTIHNCFVHRLIERKIPWTSHKSDCRDLMQNVYSWNVRRWNSTLWIVKGKRKQENWEIIGLEIFATGFNFMINCCKICRNRNLCVDDKGQILTPTQHHVQCALCVHSWFLDLYLWCKSTSWSRHRFYCERWKKSTGHEENCS